MDNTPKLRGINDIKRNLTLLSADRTKTTEEQITVEKSIFKKYEDLHAILQLNPNLPTLLRDQHVRYLFQLLSNLSSGYESLDASRPWLCYWLLHPISLLKNTVDNSGKSKIAKFLAKCQSPSGGFGGGPGQYPHLAPTYAAVNALIILGTEEAYNTINRKKLYEFLMSCKQPDGSFTMHVDGEVDIRGIYCALAVATLTQIMTNELVDNTAQYIVSCQTYEGGFGGCPGLEAHGGYTFCGIAALVILDKSHLCDIQALLRWLTQKQMKVEGGFQGRTNKLVDSCYSFWQGGAFPLIYRSLPQGEAPRDNLFDERALQEYILICCQNPQGGLIDKPGKPRDAYHSCYSLSGLALAQNFMGESRVLGPSKNELATTHPLFNIREDLVRKGMLHFHTCKTENSDM